MDTPRPPEPSVPILTLVHQRLREIIPWILIFVLLLSAAAEIVAYVRGELPLAYAGALLFLELACVVFFLLFLKEPPRDDDFGITSTWGGLGAGMGGWRISRSLVFLGCALLCAGAFAAVTLRWIDAGVKAPPPEKKEQKQTETAAPKPSSEPAAKEAQAKEAPKQ